MDYEDNPEDIEVDKTGKVFGEKKDLVVNASSCIKVLESVLNSHGVLNEETLPIKDPTSFSFVAKDKHPRPWTCPICHFPFKYRGNLAEHIRFFHMKGNIPCNRCSKTFSTSRLLRDHMREHSMSYNKCPHCGMHFTCKNGKPSTSYRFHMSLCKRKPKTPTSLQANVISKFENGESSKLPIMMQSPSPKIDNLDEKNMCNDQNSLPFRCIKCCLEFEDKESIDNHICMTLSSIEHLINSKSERHKEEEEASVVAPLALKCSKCNLDFDDQESIENHICITLNSIAHLLNPMLDDYTSKKISGSNISELSSNPVPPVKKKNLSIQEHGVNFQKSSSMHDISDSFLSASTSQSPIIFTTSFPNLATSEIISKDNNSSQQIEDSINVQIDNVFSLTQDEWKNNSEIVDKEQIYSLSNHSEPQIQENSTNVENSVRLSLPSPSTLFSSGEGYCSKTYGVNGNNISVKFSDLKKKARSQICKLRKGNEKHATISKIKDKQIDIKQDLILQNEQIAKLSCQEKAVKECSLQSDQLKTLVKAKDFSGRKVDATCGMCKSDFTEFNQFRFHYSLCKMLHLSTDEEADNQDAFDAKCNLCSRTFPVITDYVIHLETCKVSSHSEAIQKKHDKIINSNEKNNLPFNNSLCNILANCAIMLLRGSDWQCIKCNCCFSSLSLALVHYSECKSPPFSSDTSSFANYIRLICTKCNSVFKEAIDFENHKNDCMPDVTCSLSHNSEVNTHQDYGKVKSLSSKKLCPKCGHLSRAGGHSCEKLLKHMQSCFVPLKHLKTIRWDSKPYEKNIRKGENKCRECNISFSKVQDYVNHMENSLEHASKLDKHKNINLQKTNANCHLKDSVDLHLLKPLLEDNMKNESGSSSCVLPSVSKKTFWKCKSCQVIYTSLLALRQHVLSIHENKTSFPFLRDLLTVEKLAAKTEADSVLHSSKNTSSVSVSDIKVTNTCEVPSATNVSNSHGFKCMTCNCQFASAVQLQEHLRSSHSQVTEASSVSVGHIYDNSNSLISSSSCVLSNAVNIVSCAYTCNSCESSYSSPSDLENHQMLFHPFICNCGLIMNQLQATVHDKLTHGTHQIISNNLPLYKKLSALGQKDLKCTTCFTDFHTESSFLRHLKLFPRCADGYFQLKFKCSLCHLQFSGKDLYLKHAREVHAIDYNLQNSTQPSHTLGSSWTLQSMQSVKENVESEKQFTSVLHSTSTTPPSSVMEISKAPLLQPNSSPETQVSNSLCLPAESVSHNLSNTCKGDGWIVVCNKNSPENMSYNNSQVINYVCSRCYRSQPSFESLSQHIKEIHKVYLPGTLKLGTVQARKQ